MDFKVGAAGLVSICASPPACQGPVEMRPPSAVNVPIQRANPSSPESPLRLACRVTSGLVRGPRSRAHTPARPAADSCLSSSSSPAQPPASTSSIIIRSSPRLPPIDFSRLKPDPTRLDHPAAFVLYLALLPDAARADQPCAYADHALECDLPGQLIQSPPPGLDSACRCQSIQQLPAVS